MDRAYYPSEKSIIKPDLLIETEQQVTVLGITIVANPRMEQSHQLKIEKLMQKVGAYLLKGYIYGIKVIRNLKYVIHFANLRKCIKIR